MACYRNGGCGPYEMYSCSECPASKPEYLERGSVEYKDMTDTMLVNALRTFGSVNPDGRAGAECRVPKSLLRLAADRIEVLKNS